MSKDQLLISPRTKVFDLLKAYPQLEDTLIQIAPTFKKLRNPILRKTITKVTSLSQVAIIGSVKLETLINTLRKEIGQDQFTEGRGEASKLITEVPAWFAEDKIAETFDVRPLLDSGEHPVHAVIDKLKKMEVGKILKIEAPFIPLPLIEKAQSLGYLHFVDQLKPDLILVYFIGQ